MAYFHIRVSDDLKERAKQAAEKCSLKEAEFVREAVEAAIRKVEFKNAWLIYRVRKDKRAPWLVVEAPDEVSALKQAKSEFGSSGFHLKAVRAYEAPERDLVVVPR